MDDTKVKWKSPKSLQQGFSIIENLITLFILSTGVLAIAALQSKSIALSTQHFSKQVAIQLVTDMKSRMRTNPEAVHTGDYNSTAVKNASCYTLAGCTYTQMAQHDLWEWQDKVSNNLMGGIGIVCLDAVSGQPAIAPTTDARSAINTACDNTGTSYSIWIVWDSNNDGVLDSPFTFSANGDLFYTTHFQP